MIIIFLYQINIAIYTNIVNMFINNNEKDNFHYKNKKDNYFLNKIISSFIVLINDFNLENLYKFQFINGLSTPKISIESTNDIININTNISFDLIDSENNKKKEINYNYTYKNKNEIITKFIDNKSNNSELIRLNLSSSKMPLKSITYGNSLQNLNISQNLSDNNTNISNNITSNTNKTINSANTANQKLIKEKNKLKDGKNNTNKNNLNIKKNKLNNKKIEFSANDEEKMTAEIFLKKLVNKGLKEIKISLFILLILFICAIVYVIVKIVISLNFITEIREIFEDFGVISYRYSSIYYYFNTLRTLLVFPDYENENQNILNNMHINMDDKLKKMNVILDFKLKKYPTVQNYYWITGTNMKKPRPSPSYINDTCIDDQKCREIINNKKYDVLSEGIKMAITSMYQQIINIFEDYKKQKNDNKFENRLESFIKEKFINNQYEQIDINLNYVIICIEYRIYEAFRTDLDSLANKYNSIIEALNICSVIYCFIVEFIVLTFIILKLRKKTKKIEEATSRINNSFRYLLQKNINNDNKEDNSIFVNDN